MTAGAVNPREYRERWSETDEREGRVVLLDVREGWELEIAAVPGATHMPMSEVPARIGELDRARPVVVMCHSGVRSAHVAAYLAREGFADVYNLAGGIDAWADELEPGMSRY